MRGRGGGGVSRHTGNLFWSQYWPQPRPHLDSQEDAGVSFI